MKRRTFLLGAAALALTSPSGAATPSVALVLGGGGCRGYGHIGVLRGLERHGLKPNLIVGSSVGALIGAFYASGMDSHAIEKVGAGASQNLLRAWVFPRLGVFGGHRIRRLVEKHLGKRDIASLPIRFAAVATDLRSGASVILDRGEVGRAVQATASAPGLLEPVNIGGRLLSEGALSAPVPVGAARKLGAARVVAVDVTFPPEQADLSDPIDALYQGFSILTRRLALEERSQADLAIEPPIPKHQDMKPATLKAIMAAGEQAIETQLPALRAIFGRSS